MHGGIDAHRGAIGILACNFLIHVEEVAVPLANDGFTEALNCLGEIEVNTESTRADPTSLVAYFLGGPGGNVARSQIAKGWIFAFQKIIAILRRDRSRRFGTIFLAFRSPDAAIVAQGLGHERELGLMIPAHGDTGGMDLRITRIREQGALFVSTPGGG